MRYVGFRDRPLEERQMRFAAGCREGHAEIVSTNFNNKKINNNMSLLKSTTVWGTSIYTSTKSGKLKKKKKKFFFFFFVSAIIFLPMGVMVCEPSGRKRLRSITLCVTWNWWDANELFGRLQTLLQNLQSRTQKAEKKKREKTPTSVGEPPNVSLGICQENKEMEWISLLLS